MKKRWMKSVVEASKTEVTVLPFQRGQRSGVRREVVLDKPIRKFA